MAVNSEKEEFRQYLVDTGVVKALSRVLMKLYEIKDNRPNAAIAFMIKQLADDLPSITEYENVRKELKETKAVLERLNKLTGSQLAMIDNLNSSMSGQLDVDGLMSTAQTPAANSKGQIKSKPEDSTFISARQSQIMKGNRSKTSSQNQSQIRKMSRTAVGYSDSIKKEINGLLKNSNCVSLLKKFISIELYNKLEQEKTSSGSTLVDCISSGLEIHESMVGVYAADSEAYDKFEELFDPLIKEYHLGFEKTVSHPKSNWGDPTQFTNLDPKKECITSTRIRCVRTVDNFPLIPSMTKDNFADLCNQIKDVLENLGGDVSGTWYGLETLDPNVKRDMINNRYILEYGDRFLEAAGATEFWPTGRAVFLNKDKTFFVWVNEEDHLRFISMGPGGDIGPIYGRLIDALNQCAKKLNFSMHKHFGYLALCPTNLGNTIRASVMIKVPKLAKQNKLDGLAQQLKLEIRGNRGHGQSNNGEIFEISNKRKLGLTEYESIKELHDGITEIIKMEKSL